MARNETQLGPAATYEHKHPPIRNAHAEYEEKMTLGLRVADRVATLVGSWPFIIVQSCFLALWMAVNVYLAVMVRIHPNMLRSWDPYPFILLNLMLSFQAAYTGPVVMMSQNRQSDKDRLMAQNDFEINKKAEEEVEVIIKHLAHQDKLILDAISRLEALQTTPPVEDVAQKIETVLQQMDENDKRITAILERMANLHPSA